jgi:hypothetical protein
VSAEAVKPSLSSESPQLGIIESLLVACVGSITCPRGVHPAWGCTEGSMQPSCTDKLKTICVRVVRKWEFRGLNDDGPLQHIDLVLADNQVWLPHPLKDSFLFPQINSV